MDTWFCFTLKKESSEALAVKELSACRLENRSFLEDLETGKLFLYGTADENLFPSTWEHIDSWEKISGDINWTTQWENCSPYVQNGLAIIPLSDFSSSQETIFLQPGPGFGDLSHSTTLLSLDLLSHYSSKKTIIDLGCGSGILGLAALKWGADFIYSLDIDLEALKHTTENAILNNLEKQIMVSSTLPEDLIKVPTLLVMNMTFEDQKKAISSLPYNGAYLEYWITSGILKSQQKAYLSWVLSQGFSLQTLVSKEGWIACLFKQTTKKSVN